MPLAERGRLVTVVGVTAMVAVATVWFANRQLPYDPSFDARIAHPAYVRGGPVVLFDEGHLNIHKANGAYRPFADLIRSDGYNLQIRRQPLLAPVLAGAAVLIVAGARGPNDANDQPAFTEAETAAIEQWVRAGGALLLITDHWPFGSAVQSLGRRFGVQMGDGMVEDPQHHEPSLGESHLIFSTDNGLLRDHPIVRGRNVDERIHRVLTFTGQSVLGPPGAVSFMALSDSAYDLTPTPARVDKGGGNVRVSMTYGAPRSARGRAQGIAFEFGQGRVVVLGEAGMLRAQRPSHGSRVGMNYPGYDNRQLALNIMHWLTRLI